MKKRRDPEILFTHLMEGIGIALDFKGDRMFLTDLAGSIYSAKLDGTGKKPLLVAQGNLTGIAYAEREADDPEMTYSKKMPPRILL